MKRCVGPVPLTEEQLFALADNEAGVELRNHLSTCESCRERFERVKSFDEGLFGALGWGAQSRAAFREATAPWFRERPAPPPEIQPTLWERAVEIVRQLVPQPMLTVGGLKGSDDRTVQRISARAGRVTLLLEAYATEAAGQVRLKGMIIDEADAESEEDGAPFRWAGSLVELTQGDALAHLTITDPQAEFEVSSLPAGTWDVKVSAEWGEGLKLVGALLT